MEPPSTSSSTTMSALPRPTCGALLEVLSILTTKTGWSVEADWSPLTGRPVSGQVLSRTAASPVPFAAASSWLLSLSPPPQAASSRLAARVAARDTRTRRTRFSVRRQMWYGFPVCASPRHERGGARNAHRASQRVGNTHRGPEIPVRQAGGPAAAQRRQRQRRRRRPSAAAQGAGVPGRGPLRGGADPAAGAGAVQQPAPAVAPAEEHRDVVDAAAAVEVQEVAATQPGLLDVPDEAVLLGGRAGEPVEAGPAEAEVGQAGAVERLRPGGAVPVPVADLALGDGDTVTDAFLRGRRPQRWPRRRGR